MNFNHRAGFLCWSCSTRSSFEEWFEDFEIFFFFFLTRDDGRSKGWSNEFFSSERLKEWEKQAETNPSSLIFFFFLLFICFLLREVATWKGVMPNETFDRRKKERKKEKQKYYPLTYTRPVMHSVVASFRGYVITALGKKKKRKKNARDQL